MASNTSFDPSQISTSVSRGEINSWRRGFTPQAEIWNGRMAMLGLLIGFTFLTVVHFLIS